MVAGLETALFFIANSFTLAIVCLANDQRLSTNDGCYFRTMYPPRRFASLSHLVAVTA